jgi:hypothetical protein
MTCREGAIALLHYSPIVNNLYCSVINLKHNQWLHNYHILKHYVYTLQCNGMGNDNTSPTSRWPNNTHTNNCWEVHTEWMVHYTISLVIKYSTINLLK